MGVLINRILPRALQNIKDKLDPRDTLEESLLKLIKADKSDHSAKNKLRLIRIVEGLCTDDVLTHLGVTVVSLRPVEAAQYALMGFERERATLSDLIHPTRSPVAVAQQSLLDLASDFDCTAGPWKLLTVLGISTDSEKLRRLARRNVFQLSAGFTDVFELRLQNAPHRLGWLTFPDIPLPVKAAIVQEFFAINEDCLTVFCMMLKALYPDQRQFLRKAPPVIEAWLLSTNTCIDSSERHHAAMRQDVQKAGTGPAVNFVNVASRALCRQFVNAHVQRGGLDPAAVPLTDLEGVSASAARKDVKTSSRGSSAFMEFHIVRAQSYKLIMSPDKPLTPDEHLDMESSIREDWARECAKPGGHDMWLRRMRCKRDERARQELLLAAQRGQGVCELVVAEAGPPFVGLFGRSCNRNSLVPASDVVANARQMQANSSQTSINEEKLFVRSATSRIDKDRNCRSLFGCQSSKKTACRDHCLSNDRTRSLDGIIKRLTKLPSECCIHRGGSSLSSCFD
jgi:hypothetical protein